MQNGREQFSRNCVAIPPRVIIGLTACSAEMSNNYSFKPIGYEIVSST